MAVVWWEYDNARSGQPPLWSPYDAASSGLLENAHGLAQPSATLAFQHGTYVVDLAQMTQTNARTGYVRRVRRVHTAQPQPQGVRAHSFVAADVVDWAAVTGWRRVMPPAYDPAEEDLMGERLGDGVDEPVVELPCSTPGLRCVYRTSFICRALDTKAECCTCRFQFTNVPGAQPTGTMTVQRSHEDCAGHPGCGSIVLSYAFPPGVQTRRMGEPGAPYSGTARRVYLPGTADGETACRLLERAFMLGQLFIVGTSVTTGVRNTVVWANIHQKTAMHGGPAHHGWPDAGYFARLQSECAAVGLL